jgi:hypothetical protein
VAKSIEKEIAQLRDVHLRRIRLLEYCRLDFLSHAERKIYLRSVQTARGLATFCVRRLGAPRAVIV